MGRTPVLSLPALASARNTATHFCKSLYHDSISSPSRAYTMNDFTLLTIRQLCLGGGTAALVDASSLRSTLNCPSIGN